MKILDDVKLDFIDVLIAPKRSQYSTRSEVYLERTFKFKYSPYTWVGIPVMVSNMDTTGTIEMASALKSHKVLTCLHKYYTAEQIEDAVKQGLLDKEYFAVSCGIGEKDLQRLDEIVKKVDPQFIVVDVANGYMSKFIETCSKIRKLYSDKIIIAGNVCTSEGVLELVINGQVDIVKVGIGGGSCCTTRRQTGIGMPQFSAVIECADTAHGLDAHIISDGGVQVVGDFSKAYGAGADFVMSGSMFAGHEESGGTLVSKTDEKGVVKQYKTFYGMSSKTAMEKYEGGVAKYRSSEGKTVQIDYRGPVEDTILDIFGGIRSTMTYIGAKRIKDIPKCTTFIRVNRQLNNIYTGKEV